MQFSLMTYTVAPQWPGGCQSLEEMADFAVSVGFEALELSAGNLGERTAAEFGAICRSRGLAVSSINGGCPMVLAEELEGGIAAGKAMVDMAVELDCKVIMPLPGMAPTPEAKAECAARVAEGLREVVAYARPAGVTVTLEDFPHPMSVNGSIAEMTYLLTEVPGLAMTFDNGNWMIAGDDPVDALMALKDHVANVHVKDWEATPEGRMELPDGRMIRGGCHGKGLIDHPAVFAGLKQIGYDGWLAFEYEGPLDHQQATRDGMAYLQGVLAGLG